MGVWNENLPAGSGGTTLVEVWERSCKPPTHHINCVVLWCFVILLQVY